MVISRLYFGSPLQAIRAAKGRLRATHLPGMERFSRLSNVSAALLHIAMRNMGTENPELSGASYELLAAVVGSFDLDASPILTTKGESMVQLTYRYIHGASQVYGLEVHLPHSSFLSVNGLRALYPILLLTSYQKCAAHCPSRIQP
jgi:hypothetical protein